jgi:ABC-type maltose transport system permease subunit
MLQSQLKEWVLMAAMLIMTIWGLYIVTIAVRRKHQTTMQKALLDKFSSAHDFAEFMQSPAGQKYVVSFTDTVVSPRIAILNSVRAGIVLIFLGAGFYSITRANGAAHMFGDSIGALMTCLGFGFLISAAVSHWLAKKIPADTKE